MGFFSSIVERWYEARGDILRQEFEDCYQKLMRSGKETNSEFCKYICIFYEMIELKYGNILNLSTNDKKEAAKVLTELGRESFYQNMGKGYAGFIMSAYVEAHALPGDDAATVKAISSIVVHRARCFVSNLLGDEFDGQPDITPYKYVLDYERIFTGS